MFIYNFICKFGIPDVSGDKTQGGFAVMEWSLGTFFALRTVAAWDALPQDIASRPKLGMKELILHAMFVHTDIPVLPIDVEYPNRGNPSITGSTSPQKHGYHSLKVLFPLSLRYPLLRIG